MKNLNASLKRVQKLMGDGVSRSPEAIYAALSMMGEHAFHDPIDIYWMAHLAGLEKDGDLLRKKHDTAGSF
jgi:hypothetical protein